MSALDLALLKAQQDCGVVLKNKKNPHFKSSYADLASVNEVAEPALHGNDLLLTCWPTSEGLAFKLCHTKSEETWVWVSPLYMKSQTCQDLGSAITYTRRYVILCLLNLSPEDDDGNAASVRGAIPQSNKIVSIDFKDMKELIEKNKWKTQEIKEACEFEFKKNSSTQLTQAEVDKLLGILAMTPDRYFVEGVLKDE